LRAKVYKTKHLSGLPIGSSRPLIIGLWIPQWGVNVGGEATF
jgi:hypothetical protein